MNYMEIKSSQCNISIIQESAGSMYEINHGHSQDPDQEDPTSLDSITAMLPPMENSIDLNLVTINNTEVCTKK